VRPDFLHHVERPDDVGVVLAGELFVGRRTVVLAVAEAVDIQAPDHTPVARVVDVGAFDERRRRDTLVGPVVRTPGRQLLVRLLPEKLAVGFTERHQHAAIPGLLGIAWSLVVRADEYHPTRNHGVAVALRAEFGAPFHL